MDFRSGILNTTLGDLVRTNEQARNLILHSMQITPQQLNEMLSKAEGNEMMNMTVGELFKNGSFQKAQDMTLVQNVAQPLAGTAVDYTNPALELTQTSAVAAEPSGVNTQGGNISFFQKMKNLFK